MQGIRRNVRDIVEEGPEQLRGPPVVVIPAVRDPVRVRTHEILVTSEDPKRPRKDDIRGLHEDSTPVNPTLIRGPREVREAHHHRASPPLAAVRTKDLP